MHRTGPHILPGGLDPSFFNERRLSGKELPTGLESKAVAAGNVQEESRTTLDMEATAGRVEKTAAPKILITPENCLKERGSIKFADWVQVQVEIATKEEMISAIKATKHYKREAVELPDDFELPIRSTLAELIPLKPPKETTTPTKPSLSQKELIIRQINGQQERKTLETQEAGFFGIQTSVISGNNLYAVSLTKGNTINWKEITLKQSFVAGVNDSHGRTVENCAGGITAFQSFGKVVTSVPRALFEIGKRIAYTVIDIFRLIKHTAIASFSFDTDRRHLAKRAAMYNLGSLLMNTLALVAEPIRLTYRIGKYTVGVFSNSVRNGKHENFALKQMFFQFPQDGYVPPKSAETDPLTQADA